MTAPGDYGADIVTGPVQPLGVHMQCGGGVGGFIASRDEEKYVLEYNGFLVSIAETLNGRRSGLRPRLPASELLRLARARQGLDRQFDLSLGDRRRGLHEPSGPRGVPRTGQSDRQPRTLCREAVWARCRACKIVWPDTTFKEFVVNFDDTGRTVAEVNDALRARGIFGGKDISGEEPNLGPVRALLRHRSPHRCRHPQPGRYAQGGPGMTRIPEFHAAKWNEPVVMEMGRPGARGPAVPRTRGRGHRGRRHRSDPRRHGPQGSRRTARDHRVRGAAPLPAPVAR